MKWEKYDSEWLVKLAQEQLPNEEWLPSALRQCTSYFIESKAYYCFVSNKNPNQLGSEWQFSRNLFLRDSKEGELVLDVLKGQRIGGIEFLSRL